MQPTEQERNLVAARVAGLESGTGARWLPPSPAIPIPDPDVPWKAFAPGAAAAALATVVWKPEGIGWPPALPNSGMSRS
jgi:hypothetical protein